MTSFIALYRGDNIQEAKMVAVNADPAVVASVVEELLADVQQKPISTDPALLAIETGRRHALRLIKCEAR